MSIVHVVLVTTVASGSEIGLVNRVSIVQIGLDDRVSSGSEIGLVNMMPIVQIGLVNMGVQRTARPRQRGFHSSDRPNQ